MGWALNADRFTKYNSSLQILSGQIQRAKWQTGHGLCVFFKEKRTLQLVFALGFQVPVVCPWPQQRRVAWQQVIPLPNAKRFGVPFVMTSSNALPVAPSARACDWEVFALELCGVPLVPHLGRCGWCIPPGQ